jgi:hypothetical protein
MEYLKMKLFYSRIIRFRKGVAYRFSKVNEPNNLALNHFLLWSELNHPNFRMFELVISIFDQKPKQILETGSSAWGVDSTRLWAKYVNTFGGSLTTVDIRPNAKRSLWGQVSKQAKFVISDSVQFLKNQDAEFDFYYLDSWDVDWNNPFPAARHGFEEFQSIRGNLKSGNLILIDDTPASKEYFSDAQLKIALGFQDKYGVLPGKGSLVLREILNDDRYRILNHEYSLLIAVK